MSYHVTSLSPFWILGALWIAWKVLRFTILPCLHRHEPKELPYSIPFLGHAVGLFYDYNGVLERGRLFFRDSKEPYCISVGNESIYVITSPQDVAQVHKSSFEISWARLVPDMYRSMDFPKKSLAKLFSSSGVPEKAVSSQKMAPHDAMMGFNHEQLYPGQKADALFKDKILPLMNRGLDLERSDHYATLKSAGAPITVSLWRLCVDSLLRGLAEVYFGQAIWKSSPQLVEHFLEWEKTNWKLVYSIPKFLSQDFIKARNDLVTDFCNYYSLPMTQRDDCAYYIRATENVMTAAGVSQQELSIVTVFNAWTVLSNIYKVTFWMMSYLAHNPHLVDEIKREISPAFEQDSRIDTTYLTDHCPKLDSVFQETLRMVVASALIREVRQSTIIGNKRLYEGHKVLVPFFQLHRNRHVWGDDPEKFQPERFQKDPKLVKSKSLRPFGGGATLCPGRHLSRKIIFTFIAKLIATYDIKLLGQDQSFPRAEKTVPTPGAYNVVEGDDVILELGVRKRRLA